MFSRSNKSCPSPRSVNPSMVPSEYFLVVSVCTAPDTPVTQCDAQEADVRAFVLPNTSLNDNCFMVSAQAPCNV